MPVALTVVFHPVGVEFVDADAKMVELPRPVALLQNQQSCARQIESMVVRPVEPSRRRQVK
jgi:hypothetical protein